MPDMHNKLNLHMTFATIKCYFVLCCDDLFHSILLVN